MRGKILYPSSVESLVCKCNKFLWSLDHSERTISTIFQNEWHCHVVFLHWISDSIYGLILNIREWMHKNLKCRRFKSTLIKVNDISTAQMENRVSLRSSGIPLSSIYFPKNHSRESIYSSINLSNPHADCG